MGQEVKPTPADGATTTTVTVQGAAVGQGNWEQSIKEAAMKIAKGFNEATQLVVVTNFREPVASGGNPEDGNTLLVLKTTINLDGDSVNDVPVTSSNSGLTVNTDLYEIHLGNLKTAVDYRARILSEMLNAIKSRLR